MDTPTDRLITGAEVDSMFSIDRSTRYRFIKRGIIPGPIKLSVNAVRWSLKQCAEAVERHKSAALQGRAQ